MLELRPNCECCDCDLPADAGNARICSYECTFCADCVETVLNNVCPNCGGGFVPRPIRPLTARRPGVSREYQKPSLQRVHSAFSREQMREFSRVAADLPPEER